MPAERRVFRRAFFRGHQVVVVLPLVLKAVSSYQQEALLVADQFYQRPVQMGEIQIAAGPGVPEASTWVMMTRGFAGVGFMACRPLEALLMAE
jgi:hypothetical protein